MLGDGVDVPQGPLEGTASVVCRRPAHGVDESTAAAALRVALALASSTSARSAMGTSPRVRMASQVCCTAAYNHARAERTKATASASRRETARAP